jgi:hypothetical protein
MPTPEQLGVARAAESGVDWDAARRRLRDVGAVCFQLDHTPQGACRFTCLLPTGETGRNHRVEVEAATEAEAVRLALERAEHWKQPRR